MNYDTKTIFKLRDDWQSYMADSWERGTKNIDFIEKNDQYAIDKNSLSFEPLAFNFMYGLLKTAQAHAKDLELSLSLVALEGCNSTETRTFKKLVNQLMMNEDNLKSFRQSLDKVYDFGQAVLHIKNVRENESTLNNVLKVENIEDVTTTFFDKYSSSRNFHDGNYCGRSYKISAEKLRKLYPKLKNASLPKICEVIDFWSKNKKQTQYVLLETGEYKREDLVDSTRDGLSYVMPPKKGIYTTLSYIRVIKEYDGHLEKENDIEMDFLPMIFDAGGVVWDASDKKYITYPFCWHLKDTQLMINYAGSVIADLMKSTKGDRWFFNPDHLQGNKSQANADEINVREGGMIFTGDLSTIRRETPQQLPPAMVEVFNQLQGTIRSLAGSYFENNGATIKAVSGVALDKLFKRTDLIQNPVIVAHLETVNIVGKVLQKMIPLYYREERQISTQCEDGSMEMLIINQKQQQENGMVLIVNNIKDLRNKYEYKILISPSRRLQNQNIQIELQSIYQIFPKAAETTIDLYVKTLDVPIADTIAKRLAVNIPQDIIKYGNGEISYEQFQQQRAQQQQQMQQVQAQAMEHNPQTQYLQAKAHSEVSKASTDSFKAQTERERMQATAANEHIKNVSQAAKFSMENANTRHEQKMELYKTIIQHFSELMTDKGHHHET